MRELKFRVWDNRQTKFEYFSLSNITIPDRLLSQHSYPVQQYTGLKDKNGVDIYEGDIVKATSDQYTNKNFIGKVIFDEGYFSTWVNKNYIRGIWGYNDIEVIGNIFENKDLLEKDL